jgi:hypothetical protein
MAGTMTISHLAWAWNLTLNPTTKLVLIGLADGHRSARKLAEWAGITEDELDGTLAALATLSGFDLSREDDHIEPHFPEVKQPTEAYAPIKKRGKIYVLRSQVGTKLGITSYSGRKRAIELSRASGMPVTFVWETSGPLQQLRAVERLVIQFFDDRRLISEWFKIAPDEAIELIKVEPAKIGVSPV